MTTCLSEVSMCKAAILLCVAAVSFSACASQGSEAAAAGSELAPARARLGIRPNGDTEIQPDMTLVKNDELKKVFGYIDEHIDDHVGNLQKWIQQPSISN